MPKEPLALPAIVYTAGVLVADFCPQTLYTPSTLIFQSTISFIVTFGIIMALLSVGLCRLAASLFRLPPVPASRFLFPFLFLTGWTNYSLQTLPLHPADLRNLGLNLPELATLRGTILDAPSQRIFVRDAQRPSYRFLASLRVDEIQLHSVPWQPASGKILVLTSGLLSPELFSGQHVQVSGVLSVPHGPEAPGLFDYGAYLRRLAIHFQLKADSTNDWSLLTPQARPPLSDRFVTWAQNALAYGLPARDQPLDLLLAMTLGWKTIDNRIYEPFMQSGTMHIFAISGLHIALIAGILLALLRVLQLPRLAAGLVVVPLLWFYTAATGWQPSAIRSTIMMTIVIGGWALSRPANLLNSLATSAFLILLWDPQQLFGASFQLSFFVVLAIALLVPAFQKAAEALLKTDPLLPPHLVPQWTRILLKPARWLALSLAVSMASWLGSLPLTAYYFHIFSPVTLLANVIVVPLSTGALAANLASLLTYPWAPWISELFNHAAWFFMHLMILVSRLSILLPGAYSYVQSPSLVVIAFYYIALITLLARRGVGGATDSTQDNSRPKSRRSPRQWLGSRPGLALGPTLAAAGLYFWPASGSVATLTVLPLEGGFAVHTRHRGLGRPLLVDCGNSNAVQFVISPFLRAQGIDVLPALLLTHGDIRHAGGAGLLARHFRIGRALASPVRARSLAYRGALEQLDVPSGRLERVSRGSSIRPWTVLHPDSGDRFPRADDNALVLLAEMHGTRVLLLSDLGQAGQQAVLEREPELRADIVIAGLPSLGEPLSNALLQRLQPKLVIIADSEYPATERASPPLRERLARSRMPIVYTRFSGTVTLELREKAWKVRTMRGPWNGLRGHADGAGAEGSSESGLQGSPAPPGTDESIEPVESGSGAG